jgi:hypothetical protein
MNDNRPNTVTYFNNKTNVDENIFPTRLFGLIKPVIITSIKEVRIFFQNPFLCYVTSFLHIKHI